MRFKTALALFFLVVAIVIWIAAVFFSAIESNDYSTMAGEISSFSAAIGTIILLLTLEPDKE